MKPDLSPEFIKSMSNLPEQASKLMPDDAVLMFLVKQAEVQFLPLSFNKQVSEQEVKSFAISLSLVARRLAIAFDRLAEDLEGSVNG